MHTCAPAAVSTHTIWLPSLAHLCLSPVHLHQINKLLEHNQDMLVKTLESKDQALEDERTFK